jgi:hypothetical protein
VSLELHGTTIVTGGLTWSRDYALLRPLLAVHTVLLPRFQDPHARPCRGTC